ncbi:MAG: hypothetical protein PHQ28_11770 [Mycobacterium sp.]|nr:hypothetical protein [Mycobacterium sp.]
MSYPSSTRALPRGRRGTPKCTQHATVQNPSAATSWLDTAHRAVRPYSVGGYVNYVEANQPASRYFGANLPRLTATRHKV